MENLPLTLPEKQPYEGRATQKQKQKLWEIGFRDKEVIDNLGKKQASILIDQILLPGKHPENLHRTGMVRLKIGGSGLIIGALVFYFSGGSKVTTVGSFVGIAGMIAGILICLSGIDRLIASKRR